MRGRARTMTACSPWTPRKVRHRHRPGAPAPGRARSRCPHCDRRGSRRPRNPLRTHPTPRARWPRSQASQETYVPSRHGGHDAARRPSPRAARSGEAGMRATYRERTAAEQHGRDGAPSAESQRTKMRSGSERGASPRRAHAQRDPRGFGARQFLDQPERARIRVVLGAARGAVPKWPSSQSRSARVFRRPRKPRKGRARGSSGFLLSKRRLELALQHMPRAIDA